MSAGLCQGTVKHRAKTKRNGVVEFVRLLQLSAAGEVFLEGTCPLSRCPQTAKFPAPVLLGARRRWVRKATAFRGRSEQDRSALFPARYALILKTFRRNVFNGISCPCKTKGHGFPCPYEVHLSPLTLPAPSDSLHPSIAASASHAVPAAVHAPYSPERSFPPLPACALAYRPAHSAW